MTALLQEYSAKQAQSRPDDVALVMSGEHLKYGELEDASNRLARLLRESGCRRGDRVCLFLPKSIDAIVAELATLKADCAYVPIDSSSPAARVQMIVDSAEPALILVSEAGADLLDQVFAIQRSNAKVGSLGPEPISRDSFAATFSRADFASVSGEPLDWQNTTDDAAHLLFTSGSTGIPKGVVIKHANVVAFVEWATSYFGTSPDDRISGHPPLHFDLSTFDIYGTFAAGAQLHLVPGAMSAVPQRLADLIRKSELTQWFCVPSTLTYMAKLDAVKQDDFPLLKRVIWCGEVLPTPILIHWMKRLPHAQFTNLYGPTEATIASSYYTVPSCPELETEPIPIGTPCSGEELLVLDEQLRPVPAGEIGDLYIGGVGLSPGYWRDEEKTAAAFFSDTRSSEPESRIYRTGDLASVGAGGLIHFHGRADSQIKSRGYRIELGEIEAALNALGYLKESAVVGVDTDSFEGTLICCAYSVASDSDVEANRVRDDLRKTLPNYMLPARWLALADLPKNVNGKIDRRRLRELFQELAEPRHAETRA